MLTQTTYSLPTVSVDRSETEIQTRSCRNQSQAIPPMSDNPQFASNLLQTTRKSHNQFNQRTFCNLYFTPNQRNLYININLPKTQLKTYNRDPLKTHEWYCYFKPTFHDNASLSDAQKNTYLKNALRAKESVFGYSYTEEFYHGAITELMRRIGRPQTVIAACFDKLERWPKLSQTTQTASFRLQLFSDN